MKGLEALNCLINKIPLVLIETNSTKYIEDIEKELKVLNSIQKACEKYPTLKATICLACDDNFKDVYEVFHDKSSSSK